MVAARSTIGRSIYIADLVVSSLTSLIESWAAPQDLRWASALTFVDGSHPVRHCGNLRFHPRLRAHQRLKPDCKAQG